MRARGFELPQRKYPQLERGQVPAEAEMRPASAEPEMGVRVSLDVELKAGEGGHRRQVMVGAARPAQLWRSVGGPPPMRSSPGHARPTVRVVRGRCGGEGRDALAGQPHLVIWVDRARAWRDRTSTRPSAGCSPCRSGACTSQAFAPGLPSNEEDPLGHTLGTGGRDAAKFRRYHPGHS